LKKQSSFVNKGSSKRQCVVALEVGEQCYRNVFKVLRKEVQEC